MPFITLNVIIINVTGEGVDYASGPYTVTFPAGVTSVTFDIPINDDNILENKQEFSLIIMPSSLSDRISQGGQGSSIISIVDDDG